VARIAALQRIADQNIARYNLLRDAITPARAAPFGAL
jgi:hypothetical protein